MKSLTSSEAMYGEHAIGRYGLEPYPTTLTDAEKFVVLHRPNAAEQGARTKHQLENRIAALRARPQSDSRDRLIRELTSQLSDCD